jgi:CubicO group peptidase (beta-lactamase class C family)
MTKSVTCHSTKPVMPVPLRPARQPAATLRRYLNNSRRTSFSDGGAAGPASPALRTTGQQPFLCLDRVQRALCHRDMAGSHGGHPVWFDSPTLNRHVFMRSYCIGFLAVFAIRLIDPALAASISWPDAHWTPAEPATLGWSTEKLKEAEDYALGYSPTAVMIVQDGKVIASWGDNSHKVNVRSIRKSLLDALYGISVAEGKIALDRTLADLGINDRPPGLSDVERQATIRDLLMGRSGVYHAAAYEAPDEKARRPARGSHTPGSFWYYNNWDFNTLGFIYQRLTGSDIFQSFEDEVGKPIGMEDFKASDGKFVFEPVSDYPAYTMRVTARDLARFGWLNLNRGSWDGKIIVPAAWIEESTKTWSETERGLGYGYLWWVMPPPMAGGTAGYLGLGYGGQALAVIPALRLVVVQLVDVPEGQERIAAPHFFELLNRIIAAVRP